MSDSPFAVGDVVVFDPALVEDGSLQAVQTMASLVEGVAFNADDVMVVQSARHDPVSDSAWLVDVIVQDQPERGVMDGMDSSWFIRKEE